MKHSEETIFIHNCSLVDGRGGPPVPDGALLIREGKIAFGGRASEAPAREPGSRQIDALGGTVMPGLVEAHFHATYFNILGFSEQVLAQSHDLNK